MWRVASLARPMSTQDIKYYVSMRVCVCVLLIGGLWSLARRVVCCWFLPSTCSSVVLLLSMASTWSVSSCITHTHLVNGRLCGPAPVIRYQKCKNQSALYWSKRLWVAVASAGPYAVMHRQITTPSLLCLCTKMGGHWAAFRFGNCRCQFDVNIDH